MIKRRRNWRKRCRRSNTMKRSKRVGNIFRRRIRPRDIENGQLADHMEV